ncbi:Protein CBG27610 [Caenorhabditis briggsae]|uniref:Protein CBG27610 n=1 Tax=Caenorhabditis briggsae TaxID=6238 RepID=B6IJ55_CAEBR|nr:Protein CBG27610 [Caenorhabditis briggsae]CAR99889.1 Protein CBG27610 [Caenorhabditis briggsae]
MDSEKFPYFSECPLQKVLVSYLEIFIYLASKNEISLFLVTSTIWIEGSESEASTEDLQDTEGQGRTDETLFIEKENTTTNTDNLLESFVDTEGPENSVISNSCDDNIDIITDSIIRINSSISDSSSSGSPHFVRSPSLKEKFFHGYMYADSDVSGKEDKMHRLNRTNDRVEKKNESLLRILEISAYDAHNKDFIF